MSNGLKLFWSLIALLISTLLLTQPYKETGSLFKGGMSERTMVDGTHTTSSYTFTPAPIGPVYMTIETSKNVLFLNYFALFFPVFFFAQSFWFSKVKRNVGWAKFVLLIESLIVLIGAFTILALDLFDPITVLGELMFFLCVSYSLAGIVIVFSKRFYNYFHFA
jgi:hypothetical protein